MQLSNQPITLHKIILLQVRSFTLCPHPRVVRGLELETMSVLDLLAVSELELRTLSVLELYTLSILKILYMLSVY